MLVPFLKQYKKDEETHESKIVIKEEFQIRRKFKIMV